MAVRKSIDSPLGNLVRATLASVRLGELADGDLLTRFVASRDEAAFAELVRRLGPTVYGVCRRILRSTTDAEDACQVAFLVLARKAGRVHPPGRVAAWLYGVAVLAAKKARAARTRRLSRETDLTAATELSAGPAGPEPDLAGVLDEEIDRLPDRYRVPLVLCEIRELTLARAAAELGLPVGTVASRLSRARAMLGRRLAQRGVAGEAILVTGGAGNVATAVLPRALQMTLSATDGRACAPGVPLLLRRVLRAMTMNRVQAGCVAVATALGGTGARAPVTAT